MENDPELVELGLFKTKLCNRGYEVQDVAHCPWTVLFENATPPKVVGRF